MSALEATGLLPERDVMWGSVPLQLAGLPHPEKLLSSLSLGSRGVSARAPTAAAPANGTAARSHASAAAHADADGEGIPDIENAGDARARAKAWSDVHACAVELGDNFYEDPETKLMVMTELVHRSRGTCCGKACRHCPFMHDRVSMRARPNQISRPAWLVPPPSLSGPSVPGVPKGAIGVSNGLTAFKSHSKNVGDVTATAVTQNRMGAVGMHEQPTVATGALEVSTGAAATNGCDTSSVAVMLCGCSDGDLEVATARQQAGELVVLAVPLGAETRTVADTDMHVKHACDRAAAAGVPLVGVPVHEGGPTHSALLQAALQVTATAVGGGQGSVSSTEVRESLGAVTGEWRAAAG